MRHPFVVACLFVTIVAIAATGFSALPHMSEEGCKDAYPGTRDADVSLQVFPLGFRCDYAADSTGPAEVVTLAASVPVFGLWLLLTAGIVGFGLRRWEHPAARGVVVGAFTLGLYGVATVYAGFGAGFGIVLFFCTPIIVALSWWFAPKQLFSSAVLAVAMPFVVVSVWFTPWAFGLALPAVLLPLAAAAGASVIASWLLPPSEWLPQPFEPRG